MTLAGDHVTTSISRYIHSNFTRDSSSLGFRRPITMSDYTYFAGDPEVQELYVNEQQDVFPSQQFVFDQAIPAEKMVYPLLESTEIAATLPLLFSDVPFSTEFSTEFSATEVSQVDCNFECPNPHPKFIQLGTPPCVEQWLDPFSVPQSASQQFLDLSLSNGVQAPVKAPALRKPSSTSRTIDKDKFQAMLGSFSVSKTSRSGPLKQCLKRKTCSSTISCNTRTQLTTSRTESESRDSSKTSKTLQHQDILAQSSEALNIDLPKSKKPLNLPRSLMTVFHASTERRKGRSMRQPYTDEVRKKVEDVRKIGACLPCRCRKRTVKLSFV